ncbi:Hypothetical predicted protein [Octopus vulgaris]|uniref:Uncharacterized protein n=1 Tax=Octopus vulgaris TaxID=6645 RepID=A0AA36BVX0_OCTVU|nr:Hypothetical predicted protein [Octopus vulgaris]
MMTKTIEANIEILNKIHDRKKLIYLFCICHFVNYYTRGVAATDVDAKTVIAAAASIDVQNERKGDYDVVVDAAEK